MQPATNGLTISSIGQCVMIAALGLVNFWFNDGDTLSEKQVRTMVNELHIQGGIPPKCEWTFHTQLPRRRKDTVLLSLCGRLTVYLTGRVRVEQVTQLELQL